MRKAFCCSTVYICPRRKLSGASWPAVGLFHRGEGDASVTQGLEVTLECGQAYIFVCVCVSPVLLCVQFLCVCVSVCGAQSL